MEPRFGRGTPAALWGRRVLTLTDRERDTPVLVTRGWLTARVGELSPIAATTVWLNVSRQI